MGFFMKLIGFGKLSGAALLLFAGFTSCGEDQPGSSLFKKQTVSGDGNYELAVYTSFNKDSEKLLVFESGLGDDHAVWLKSGVAGELASSFDVILYDRAGYGASGYDTLPRIAARCSRDLEKIIRAVGGNRKVYLAGHSFGGLIIREFALAFPEKTNGLLFIDPSHEQYNSPDEETEMVLAEAFREAYGPHSGAAAEAEQLMESLNESKGKGPLPDVPVTVLTSMKEDEGNRYSDEVNQKTRQDWYQAHESLKTGVTRFVHRQTLNSGHYIQLEEPGLVLSEFLNLLK